ncbi:MAG: hypothetical protein ABSD58_12125 [Verrucomicrobiia bacterium]|jgi:hypothetical protein
MGKPKTKPIAAHGSGVCAWFRLHRTRFGWAARVASSVSIAAFQPERSRFFDNQEALRPCYSVVTIL